ncbi:hypothetical protein RCL_jg15918.t1 [Rhizophagus clarus]|nr:hypothetical protein RCL_jg15918.t1 [Rhizophagus clarus]
MLHKLRIEFSLFISDISRNDTVAELCDMIVEKRNANYSGKFYSSENEEANSCHGTDGRVTILNKPFDPSFNIGNALGGIKMFALDEIHTHFNTILDK